ncbi:MAG: hypothetical protein JO231_21340 [Acidobacteria bacterium]|nr:hypothetical protein [Acidobacteriota bacterium]
MQNRVTLLGTAAVLFAFVTLGAILYASDALVFTGDDPSAKVVSATLALIGTFLATVVTVVGLLLKHSLDTRAELRLELEAQRNVALQKEAESRLKLEAAIRAIQLFATENGTPSLPIQRAGALLALSNLGYHAFTVALLWELLDNAKVEPSTLAAVIDNALSSTEESVHRDCASILFLHAEKFVTPSGFEFPHRVVHPNPNLPTEVRIWAPLAFAKILLARPVEEWRHRHPHAAYAIVGAVADAWRCEPEDRIRANCGAILKEIIQAFPQRAAIREHVFATMLPELSAPANSEGAKHTVTRLRQWRTVRVEAGENPDIGGAA